MATWIVHLRVAERLLGEVNATLDEHSFALGNIAPDSGIPDENWEHFDPPPMVTHFQVEHPRYRSADVTFYREHLLPLRNASPDATLFSLRLGYFFHLITDNLWYQQVGKPAMDRWRGDFADDAAFWSEIKGDWYGLDHAYVRAHPDSLFWRVFVQCRYERDDLPFLPPQAVRRQLAYIQDWYRSDDEEIRAMLARPFDYLNAAQAEAFVDGACEKLAAIYRRGWLDGAAVDGAVSALEWLDS